MGSSLKLPHFTGSVFGEWKSSFKIFTLAKLGSVGIIFNEIIMVNIHTIVKMCIHCPAIVDLHSFLYVCSYCLRSMNSVWYVNLCSP